ncbi:predicted protein [Naegleria gruberi]|uniref:Predicted protein n=1 Tax=Naegleria gruberi TaxID=5762 RepID=D2VBM7_NAEGR|nr:uncharacterized protein NAEGRDRAFT_66270 [Naegleria gruberi]EFC45822.1 predicted protein [Naegleria gruberi]|eukprot:XP_002678566.1 predicted protein [Naegleria gruberi strain NEG-M]
MSIRAARLSWSTVVRVGKLALFSNNTNKKIFSHHQFTKLNTFNTFTNININNTNNAIRQYHSKSTLHNNTAIENVTLEDSIESSKKDRIQHLTDVLDLNPNFAPALLERGLLYQELHDFTNSCIDLEKAIEIDPNIEGLVNLHTQLGYMYSKVEKCHEKAILHLEKALDLCFEANIIPSNIIFMLTYTLYDNNGHHEKSIKLLTRGIKFLSSLEATEELSELYVLRGNTLISEYKMFERGNQDYETSLQLGVKTKLYCLRIILNSYVNLQLFDDKILMYYNMASDIIKQFEAENVKQLDYHVAEMYYTEYSKINTIMRDYYWNRKEFTLAQQYAGEAIYKNNPENIRIDPMQHNDYRCLCLLNGNFRDVLENVEYIYGKIASNITVDLSFKGEYSELFGNKTETLISQRIFLGLLYEADRQIDNSILFCGPIKELLKDYKIDENFTCIPKEKLETLYHVLEGYCNLHQGDHSLLNENISLVVKYFPFYLFTIGTRYKIRNEMDRSREYYLQYFDKSGDLEGLSEATDCLISLNRYEEAVEESDKLLERDPLYIHALYNKGESLFHLGKLESARKCFDLAITEAEKQNHKHLELMVHSLKQMWPQYLILSIPITLKKTNKKLI